MKRALIVLAICALVAGIAGTASAHHQPEFGNLRQRVNGLENQIERLKQQPGIPGPAGPQGPQGPQGVPGTPGSDGADGTDGTDGTDGEDGTDGQDGVLGYQVFTTTQDFGPGGIGGAWCGAPDANTTDQGWVIIGGGAQLLPADVDKGFAIAGEWPNTTDPLNPGWNIQLNKPPNQDPGNVTLYAVCAKEPV